MVSKNCSPLKSTPLFSNTLKPKNYSSRSDLKTGMLIKNNYIDTDQTPSLAINMNLS